MLAGSSSSCSTLPAITKGGWPMDFIIEALVLVVRLALAGFVMWGGWLCFRTWFRGQPAAAEAAPAAPAKNDGFERVASLVLLALLCTAMLSVP